MTMQCVLCSVCVCVQSVVDLYYIIFTIVMCLIRNSFTVVVR